MATSAAVEELLRRGLLWQGQAMPEQQQQQVVASGWRELNQYLAGGWPVGSVNELQLSQRFSGELALLLPLIKQQESTTVWLNPPALPYAAGLDYQQLDLRKQLVIQEADAKLAVWALEQAIKHPAVGLVLAWCDELTAVQVRRLQAAAEAAQNLVFILTTSSTTEARSYVTRVQLHGLKVKSVAAPTHLHASNERSTSVSYVPILQFALRKRRSGWPLADLECAIPDYLPRWRQRSGRRLTA